MSMSFATYRIETSRLIIRAWEPTDAERMRRAEEESRDHLSAFMLWAKLIPQPMDDVVAKIRAWRVRFDRDEDFMYGVFDRDSGAIVGGTGIHVRVGAGGVEIGYWVHPSWTKKGIATEVAGALTRVAFEVGEVRFVEIRCAKSNVASALIPPKLGFTHEATLRKRIALPNRDDWDDSLIFGMLSSEYESSPAKHIEVTAAFDAAGRRLM